MNELSSMDRNTTGSAHLVNNKAFQMDLLALANKVDSLSPNSKSLKPSDDEG